MDRFTEEYKKLNKAQKEAVDTLEGPVMVIAGPGTGKTTILTLRIANILKSTDTPPSGILAITFTDAGVKAMKTKLRALIGSRADEVRIHTFHGFASSLMSEFPDHFLHIDGFTQMTDVETTELIKSILEDVKFADLRPLGKPDAYEGSIIAGISEAKREALTSKDIKEYVQTEITRLTNDPASLSTRGATKGSFKAEVKKQIEKLDKTRIFAEVFERYEEQKKTLKLLDYDDLILNVVLALGQDELLLRLVQERFLYLLVDEHQDTNDTQNLMIRMIADFFENPNIFIVGDEKQAIYRFQGASVENFLKFSKAWPQMKIISLEENYRSHQHILDASYKMIEANYAEGEHEHLRVKLKAGASHDATPIDVVHAKDRRSQDAFLIEELRRIEREEPQATVAVISRTNREVDCVIKRVEEAGISIAAERSIDIFSHPVGTIFFALAKAVADPADSEALGKTLVAGLWKKEFADAVRLLGMLRKGNIDEVVIEIPELTQLRSHLLEDNPMLAVMMIVEASGFTKLIIADPAYVEVWRAILNVVDQLIKQYRITDPLVLLEKLHTYKEVSEGKHIKIAVGTSEAHIKAMTSHGSKGLEFDYVFIPTATEEAWLPRKRGSSFILPSKKLEKDGDEVRDARRLFYVALTRARKHASIIVPSEDTVGELATRLRFVDELDPASVKVVEADVVEEREAPKLKHKHVRLAEYAKHVLLEKGLSVTALNHFLTCPAQYLFKSILRVPEAPSATAEKGTAMHAAISEVWKQPEAQRTKEYIEETIKHTAHELVGKSYLPRFEKDAVIKELEKNASDVASCLVPHFHISGEVRTESWVETLFEGIRLHGKLDTVIETGDQTLVFDYKTKKKMSKAEIKGETANSDGGYFRQLVFYKMLLQKNVVPSLVFLTPDDKGNCETQTLDIDESDIEMLKHNIRSLIASVMSGDIVTGPCEEETCEWCALYNLLSISALRAG